jgi:hypothetical protein
MNEVAQARDDSWVDTRDGSEALPSGAGMLPWRLRILMTEEFESLGNGDRLGPRQQLLYLLRFGLLAPTTHNTVPERFRFLPGDAGIEICLDRRSVLPQSDRDGRQATVSLGCVAANIEIAARCYGRAPSLAVMDADVGRLTFSASSEGRYEPLIHITTSERNVPDHPSWLQAMRERKVVRAEYDEAVALAPALAERIQSVVREHYPLIQLHLLTERPALHALGKYQEDADRFVFESDAFCRELGDWLLPNDGDDTSVGMRGQEFGFDDQFSRKLHRGLRRLEPLLPDEIAALASGGKAAMRSSTAAAIISVERDTVRARIEAGRAYEHLALLLHLEGFSTAVHAGITEVPMVRQMLAGTLLHTTRRPAVIFRIGRPQRSQDALWPHSVRPVLGDLLMG